MIWHPELLPIAAVVLMGGVVLWANPGRTLNRLFFTAALHVGAWMLCVHIAVINAVNVDWVRAACMVGAFIPAHMWFLKEASIGSRGFWSRMPRRRNVWIFVAAGIASLALTPSFAVPRPGTHGPQFGIPYFAFMLGFGSMFAVLWRETLRDLRAQAGAVRLELQILLLGGSAAALAVLLLMALHAVTQALWPIQLQPFVILAFYSATVLATTTHRIFDAQQIVLVIAQKVILVAGTIAVAYATNWVLDAAGLVSILAAFITVSVALWFAFRLSRRLDRFFRFYAEADAVRNAIYTAARETRLEKLMSTFGTVLRGWGRSEHALVQYESRNTLLGGSRSAVANRDVLDTMRELRWATPERLSRERGSPSRDAVLRFLRENQLGVLAYAEGPSLVVLAGVGVGASRLPFTYPQVTQLLEFASIMESAFERAHLSTKAQHAEQLATVGLLGASLAHEIRNPLVTIKTFVQLLPAHYQDATFRDKFFRLMADEVNRIDRLTEQLLDLASPRAYAAATVELHPIVRATLDLIATKAAHRNVEIVSEFGATPDSVHTDAGAAKQVMLNLCFNAIQALETKEEGPRRIWVGTRNTGTGVEVTVADNGPGIAPEVLPRLFQPFQTTKSSGFGLGLAICSDILTNLNASITVDPPEAGRGATFRVTFPCQPSSS